MSDTTLSSDAQITIITFDRTQPLADEILSLLRPTYNIQAVPYESSVFEDYWKSTDCFICLMASGITIRKIAPLIDSKWEDPAVVTVDSNGTYAVPLLGGHHGANQIANELRSLDIIPAVTTASEIAGRQSVEQHADTLNATIENRPSTVATNLAILEDNLAPIVRVDGPSAVLVDDQTTVLSRNVNDGVVIGTGSKSGATKEQFLSAWQSTLATADISFEDVECIATGTCKQDESGLFSAAQQLDLGVVCFDKNTLSQHQGPSESKAAEILNWPGIAEASAIAAGQDHELLVKKQQHEKTVTVAVAR